MDGWMDVLFLQSRDSLILPRPVSEFCSHSCKAVGGGRALPQEQRVCHMVLAGLPTSPFCSISCVLFRYLEELVVVVQQLRREVLQVQDLRRELLQVEAAVQVKTLQVQDLRWEILQVEAVVLSTLPQPVSFCHFQFSLASWLPLPSPPAPPSCRPRQATLPAEKVSKVMQASPATARPRHGSLMHPPPALPIQMS